MPQPRVFEVMQAFRVSLLKRERRASTRLINAYGEVYRRLLPQIEALIAALEMGDIAMWKQYKLERLQTLKKQIEVEINEYAVFADQEIVLGAKESIAQAGRESKIVTQAALPGFEPLDARIMHTWNRLPADAVETLLGFLAKDAPLRKRLSSLGTATAELVEKRVSESIALGYNPRKIAAMIRTDLGQSLTWALRTARTTQLYSYREAARANYLANDHIVKGWIWRCARDQRTCMSCIAMDGSRHPLTERLNDHYNGRCAAQPETFSYRELGIDVDEGPPLVAEDAKSWFSKQPEPIQRNMMGNAKYEAWRAGKFELDALTQIQDDEVWGDMRVETPLEKLLERPSK